MARISPQARSRSRRAALQAIYQWQMTHQSPQEITTQFLDDPQVRKNDDEYFEALVHGVIREVGALDEQIAGVVDRPSDQLDPVERAILRLATFELVHRIDVPWRVVVDEAVKLAHAFGADQSHRFVNANLDALARQVRIAEIDGQPRSPRPHR